MSRVRYAIRRCHAPFGQKLKVLVRHGDLSSEFVERSQSGLSGLDRVFQSKFAAGALSRAAEMRAFHFPCSAESLFRCVCPARDTRE